MPAPDQIGHRQLTPEKHIIAIIKGVNIKEGATGSFMRPIYTLHTGCENLSNRSIPQQVVEMMALEVMGASLQRVMQTQRVPPLPA